MLRNTSEPKLSSLGPNKNETLAEEEGVFALMCIPEAVTFGPYLNIKSVKTKSGHACQLDGQPAKLKRADKTIQSNWMQYVRHVRQSEEHNLIAFQYGSCVYYRTEKQIEAGEELLVYYSEELLILNGINSQPVLWEMIRDIFACIDCRLGYDSKEDLTYHMATCPHSENKYLLLDLVCCRRCKIFVYGQDALRNHENTCLQNPSSIKQVGHTVQREPNQSRKECPNRNSITTSFIAYPDEKRSQSSVHCEEKFLLPKQHHCVHCRKTFSRAESLKQHTRLHTGEKPYKCDHCGKEFRQKSNFNLHILIHTTKEKQFKCDLCEKTFAHHSYLKKHMPVHSGEKRFKCDDCGKAFTCSASLKSHIFIHADEKPFKCELCEKSFPYALSLKKHILVHTHEKPFKCDQCGRTFSQASHLKTHGFVHSGVKPFKCEHCGKSFSHAAHMKSHILSSHTGVKPFKCDRCEKAFSFCASLKKHIRTHTGEKPYKCDHCGRTFSETGSLKRHIPMHTGEKRFKCDRCEKAFPTAGTLKQHIQIHSDKRPFKCDRCGRCFSLAVRLRSHYLIHTGEKPFICDYCGKTLSRAWSLNNHILLFHTG